MESKSSGGGAQEAGGRTAVQEQGVLVAGAGSREMDEVARKEEGHAEELKRRHVSCCMHDAYRTGPLLPWGIETHFKFCA